MRDVCGCWRICVAGAKGSVYPTSFSRLSYVSRRTRRCSGPFPQQRLSSGSSMPGAITRWPFVLNRAIVTGGCFKTLSCLPISGAATRPTPISPLWLSSTAANGGPRMQASLAFPVCFGVTLRESSSGDRDVRRHQETGGDRDVPTLFTLFRRSSRGVVMARRYAGPGSGRNGRDCGRKGGAVGEADAGDEVVETSLDARLLFVQTCLRW